MDYIKFYSEFLKRFIKVNRSLKVVFDCSDGTAGLIVKKVFENNKFIKTKFLNSEPDGNFPGHGPDPWQGDAIPALGRVVLKEKADLGVIFDADGDRVFFTDDRGRHLIPDLAAALISRNFKGGVILDLRAGFLARELIAAKGQKITESRVGHFFIKKLMRKKKISFAAETSGHYYFKDFFYADSGVLAFIYLLNQISNLEPGLKLSTWMDSNPKYSRVPETNFKIKDKNSVIKKVEEYFKKSASRILKIDGLKMEFKSKEGDWWFSLRPSNTEDLLRLNLEARQREVFEKALSQIKKLIG